MKTFAFLIVLFLYTHSAPAPDAHREKDICKSCNGTAANPVCGTDNNDYDSSCLLECAAKKKNDPTLKVFLNEPCNNGVKCECPGDLKSRPVCDTNGETHDNACQFKCYKKSGAKVKHQGPCTAAEESGSI